MDETDAAARGGAGEVEGMVERGVAEVGAGIARKEGGNADLAQALGDVADGNADRQMLGAMGVDCVAGDLARLMGDWLDGEPSFREVVEVPLIVLAEVRGAFQVAVVERVFEGFVQGDRGPHRPSRIGQ